jgi:BON domain-containing protein
MEVRMSYTNQFVAGIALGAGLAYLFDPNRGNRRRALIRDKMLWASRKTGDAAGAVAEDVKNRMYGTYAALRSSTESAPVSDEVLVARVRRQLGRVVSHRHAVDVSAWKGVVTLHGPIWAAEEPVAVRTARRVRGVTDVRNELEPHEDSEHIPSLQGRGRIPSTLKSWWKPTTAAVLGVAALVGTVAATNSRSESRHEST